MDQTPSTGVDMARRMLVAAAVALVVVMTGCTSGDDSSPLTISTTVPNAESTVTTATASTTTSTRPPTTTTSTTTTLPEPPHLEVLDPAHGATVTSARYTFMGVTDPGCTVTVGGKYEATVAEDASWSLDLLLEPGRNSTTFTATHPETGLETSQTMRLYYADAPGLAGQVVRPVWEQSPRTQQYYLGSVPTGYFSGSRLPLVWEGDDVALRLGFATRDPSYQQGRLDVAFEGLITLLGSAGRDGGWETWLVHDEEPVMIAPNAGVLTAMCPVDDIPHVVNLGFGDGGLRVVQAWRIDLDSLQLTRVSVDELDCPDLSARPTRPDGIGTIAVYRHECMFDPLCRNQIHDVSTGPPNATQFWTHGGSMIPPDDLFHGGYAVSVVADNSDPDSVTAWRFWLKEMVARDWTGSPIWRVHDATPTNNHPAALDCYSTDRDDLVVAVLDDWENRHPVKAWTANEDRTRFVEVDPAPVVCPEDDF